MIHRQQHKAHIDYENPSSLQHHLSNTHTLSLPNNPFSSKDLTGDTGGAPTGARRTGGGFSRKSDTQNHTGEPSHPPPSSSSCATAYQAHPPIPTTFVSSPVRPLVVVVTLDYGNSPHTIDLGRERKRERERESKVRERAWRRSGGVTAAQRRRRCDGGDEATPKFR
ncbi:hypothetical protein Hanom_Chr01g00051791 [Helianthus anomalus]